MDDYSAYKESFLKAARERIESAQKSLAGLTSNPEDGNLINQVYIDIHSLTSQNMAMGHESTGGYVRVIETYLYGVKNKTTSLTPEKINLLNNAVLEIKNSVDAIERGEQEVNFDQKRQALENALRE